MHRIIALATVLALAFVSTGHSQTTQPKKKKPSAATTQQQPPPPGKKNEYGPGCKNQGASIMSGGCVQ
jgi:hypothetical protein